MDAKRHMASLSDHSSAPIPADAVTPFDLQAHSTYSDGALAAAEVVARAAAAGVSLLALTDHDTVDGVDEALAAARRHGITLVPATEISSVDPDGPTAAAGADLHLLGYGIDHRDPALRAALADARADRERRADAMAGRLRELGFALADEALRARAEAGLPIGRPHIAAAVHGHPANAPRLREEGLAGPKDVLVAYLIPGRPAFTPRTRPTVAEAITLIHHAGGVAVWAHPFWDVDDADEVRTTLARFAALGLDGVEAFYVSHEEAQVRLLHAEAQRLGLLSTGSSDFHAPGHELFDGFGAHRLHGLQPRLGPIAAGPPTPA